MGTRGLLVACAVALALATPASAASWTQWRDGPAHLGVNPFETTLGVDTVRGLHPACASSERGSSLSTSPSVTAGIVVNTAFDRVVALDESTCALRWAAGLGSGSDSSPAIAGGRVIVATFDSGAYAFDLHSGAPLWHNPQAGLVAGSPTVAGGTAYFVTVQGSAYALDAATGQLRWRRDYPTVNGAFGAPTVAGGRVFFGTGSGQMRALRASDGKSLWTRGKLGFGTTQPAARDGVLYFAGGTTLYAFDAVHGDPIWAVPTGSTELVSPAPAVAGQLVWLRTRDRTLRAFDAATGAPRFATVMGGQVPEPGNAGDASPTVANGVVYVTSSDSRLYAFDASDGTLLTSVPTVAAAYGPVTVVNGRVWLGTGDIRCLACSFAGG